MPVLPSTAHRDARLAGCRPLFLTLGGFAFVAITLVLLRIGGTPASVSDSGIPIPFATESVRLQGALNFIGKRNGIDVYEVTYTNGEIAETLLPDRIYLVHVPDAPDIVDASLDAVFSAITSNGRNINFFGYKYTDADATVERSQINAFLFKDRFPGQFFASKKARDEDAQFGNMLAAYEAANGITFRKTDGSAGSTFLNSDGSLFVFVVNDETGARFHVRRSGVCGNGILEPTEDCDDGNSAGSDACTNSCSYGIPIPFGSGDTATGARLSLTVQTTAQNGTALHGQTGVTLMRLNAAAADDVRLTKLILRAESGSLANATRYALWRDTNGDDKVDAALQTNVSPLSGFVTFDAIGGTAGTSLARGTAAVFEVIADIVASPASGHLRVGLAVSQPDYAAGVRVTPSLPLSGIRTGGTCTQPVCEITVTNHPSVAWRLIAAPVCGNAVIEADEQCDEGQHNGTVCTPTNGGSCTYCSAQCSPVTLHGASMCGNGTLNGSEACDDGNGNDADGCSSSCTIEAGFSCTGTPSVCTPQGSNGGGSGGGGDAVCGNGAITGVETCDDANTTAGDGCSAACVTEANFRCTGSPSACIRFEDYVLGLADTNDNGVVSDTEALLLTLDVADAPEKPYVSVAQFDIDNDGDVDNTDVSIILTILDALTESAAGGGSGGSTAVCGNGAITGSETCDDANTTAGDGCSATCATESGFSCNGAPSVCNPADQPALCGNGEIDTSETCDDADATSGDGCSSVCAVEPNFRCTGTPSVCVSYADYVKQLADTNHNGVISDTEALLLTLDVVDAPDLPYASVAQFDIDNDGDVDDADVTTILSVMDTLMS